MMSNDEPCSHHDKKLKNRHFVIAGLVILVIIGITCLSVWLGLHPEKPRFEIPDATIHNLTLNSSPDLLSSVFQITIKSRNPNARLAFYYDNLNVFATYRDQQISLYTSIPPTYQGHEESNIWSPLLMGINVPISPWNVYALAQDQAGGTIPLVIRIMGEFRWRLVSTAIKSRATHLHVSCPAYIPCSRSGIQGGTSIKVPLLVDCEVS
uniref:Late embryogenesis abundant protein LEA-2 subgroup domain-containing protein n=2 Tax=Daucus carota subsp. sativus TaxID=79200 RepID=A0A161ZZ54_DAUCS